MCCLLNSKIYIPAHPLIIISFAKADGYIVDIITCGWNTYICLLIIQYDSLCALYNYMWFTNTLCTRHMHVVDISAEYTTVFKCKQKTLKPCEINRSKNILGNSWTCSYFQLCTWAVLLFMYRRPTLYPLEIAVDFLKSP